MAGIQLVLDLKNKLNEALGRADKQVDSFAKTTQRKLDSIKAPSQAYKGFDANKLRMIQGVRDEVPALNTSMLYAGNTAAIVGLGVATLGTGLAYATSLSRQWEQGMAKVNVTAQLNRTELKLLSNQLREIGKTAPVDVMQIPEAFNTIISAVGDVNKSIEILPLALKASKAGFTDLKTVADASVSVINASGRRPDEVFNVLFATMNKGKAEFADIANFLPKIIPTSKALGLSLEQTAGSWAFLTAKGLKAEQASIGMQNLIKSFSDMKTVGKFKDVGISLFNKDGSLKQMTEIMTSLQGKLKGMSDSGRVKFMDTLGLDQEASIALGLMVQNVQDLKNTIGFVANGADHLNQAFLNSATSTDLTVFIINRIKAELMSVGDIILTYVRPTLQFMAANMDTILDIVKGLTVGVMAYGLAWSIAKLNLLSNIPALLTNITLTGVLTSISAVLAAINPFAWIGIAIGGLAFLWFKFDKFRAGVMGAWEMMKIGASIWWDGVKNVFMGLFDMLGAVGRAIKALFKGDFDGMKTAISDAGAGMKRAVVGAVDASVTGIYKNKDKIISAGVKGYNDELKSVKSKTTGATLTDNIPRATGAGADYTGGAKAKGTGDGSVGSGISSGGRSVQIVVHGGLIGKLDVNVTELNGKINALEVEKIITETVMKALRNVETNYN